MAHKYKRNESATNFVNGVENGIWPTSNKIILTHTRTNRMHYRKENGIIRREINRKEFMAHYLLSDEKYNIQ